MATPIFNGALVCALVTVCYITSLIFFRRSKIAAAVLLLMICGASLSI